jgi:uncharacterized membrane protein
MKTGTGFQRLITFSDGVVAIALTLLVLPLVDIPVGLGQHESLATVFGDHHTQLTSFLISFVVIWSLWETHHSMLEHFRAYDRTVLRLHELWLFTIVVLPFTTELLNAPNDIGGAVPLYIANLLVSALALRGISSRGRHHVELLHADSAEVTKWLAEPLSFVMTAIMTLALVVSVVLPSIGTWPLLLLVLDDPIDRLVQHWRRGPSTPAAA